MDQISVNIPTKMSVSNNSAAPLENSISIETLANRMNKYILVNSINTYTSKDKGNLQYYT